MIDKWLLLNLTTDEAHAFRRIEDACRDNDDFGFFTRVRDELKNGGNAADILRRYGIEEKRADGVDKLLQQWPDAIEIKYDGTCEMCQRDGLLSFRLPHHEPDIDEDVLLFCGYFCPHCNFSNAGRRNE